MNDKKYVAAAELRPDTVILDDGRHIRVSVTQRQHRGVVVVRGVVLQDAPHKPYPYELVAAANHGFEVLEEPPQYAWLRPRGSCQPWELFRRDGGFWAAVDKARTLKADVPNTSGYWDVRPAEPPAE